MKTMVLATMGLILASGAARAEGDAAAGANVFKKCQTCHMVGENAKTRVGPVLNGVFGRTAGSLDGYKFSPAMAAAGAGGLVWTPTAMAEYLPKPRTFIKGTKMTFPGLRDQADIDNLIAYLLTFSPDWKPDAS